MKDKNYSIRLTEKMMEHIVNESRKMQLLPSEYLRNLILRDMEIKRYAEINK